MRSDPDAVRAQVEIESLRAAKDRLEARVKRLERILRDQGAHEPDCPAGWRNTTSGWGVGACACWLSESVD